MSTPSARAGRPRASSQRMLEEAASELFVENTYAKTTIEQITQRAGVSRNTFFNYFSAKSDLLWVELDASTTALTDALAATSADSDPLDAVESALCATAAAFSADRTPLVLTQYETMGIDAELRAAGLARALGLAVVIERFLAPRLAAQPASPAGSRSSGLPADPQEAAFRARAIALAVLGAASAAVGRWASDGPQRQPLERYLSRAVHPVLAGFAADGPQHPPIG